MRIQAMRLTTLACLALGFTSGLASAQQVDPNSPQAIRAELEQLRQEYGARLSQLEARLKAVEGGQATQTTQPASIAAVPPGAEGAGGPTGTLPIGRQPSPGGCPP